MVALIRSSFALVAPQAEELGRHFYATLFGIAPETRDLFPVNMEVQRSRLLRALVHVVQMVDRPTSSCRSSSSSAATTASSACSPSTTTRSAPRCSSAVEHVRGRGLDAGGREGLDRRLRHRRRARCARPPRPSAGPATWLGRVVGPPARSAGTSPVDRRAGQRADPVPGGPVRQRRDAAAAAAVALPLARQRAAPRRLAGVPRAGGAAAAGSAARSSRTPASATPGGSGRRWAG